MVALESISTSATRAADKTASRIDLFFTSQTSGATSAKAKMNPSAHDAVMIGSAPSANGNRRAFATRWPMPRNLDTLGVTSDRKT